MIVVGDASCESCAWRHDVLYASWSLVVEKPGIADNRSGLQGFQSTNPNYFTLVWWRWLPTFPIILAQNARISFREIWDIWLFDCFWLWIFHDLKNSWTNLLGRLLSKLSESFTALCSQAPLRPADEAPNSDSRSGGWWNDDVWNEQLVVWLF